MREQIKQCLHLQDAMNSVVNEDWINKDWDWGLAATQEFAEMIEHVGWKWWKAQEMDRSESFTELVDVFHFYLSAVIKHHGSVQSVENSNAIDTIINQLKSSEVLETPRSIINCAQQCIAAIIMNPFHQFDLSWLMAMTHGLGYTADDLINRYIAKNALNLFRQAHGYKTGEYIKIWNGEEDNVVMARLITDNPDLLKSADHLQHALGEHYPG